MQKAFILLAGVATLFFAACNSGQPETKSISTKGYFSGKWQANRLTVLMHTVFNGEQDSLFSVGPGEFMLKLRVKPHTLEFKEDGSFVEQYYNMVDSVILENTGTWSAKLDTLTLTQIQPFLKDSKYKFVPNVDSVGNAAGLNLFEQVDFDFDGKKDDGYSLYMIPYVPKQEPSWWESLFSSSKDGSTK